MAKKIPVNKDKHFSDYITHHVVNSMFLEPVTEQEILNIVKLFKNKHSRGHDGIPMFLLKNVIHNILKPLSYICNLSLKNGIFPEDMKMAKVIPLYKKEDPMIFSNYRPVSLLTQFSKILEKIFNNRLTKFITINNVLYDGQYGFRHNHSTELAVLEMIEKITNAIDNKMISIGIFIDLKKAFDTINHDILVQKLSNYGLRGVASKWISSYLENRSQFVSYNNVNSDIQNINCGIPQGSISGPSLFILYINDLKFIFFADDTNIFYEGVNHIGMQKTVNDELKKVNVWFMVNGLSLNVKKN